MITSNIIGYSTSATSGKAVYSYNPATQQYHETPFTPATESEVDEALQKAHAAWRIGRNMPTASIAAFLRAIAIGIEELGEILINAIKEETAYPEARIIVERNRTCAQLRMFADLTVTGEWKEYTVDEALPSRTPSPRPKLERMMMPIGPVVVFGASNFPLAYSTMGGDAVSALAVGCPVVIKAHESHLRTNAFVAEVVMNCAKATGMPDGMFSSLVSNGHETGMQLVMHPLTAAVGFTGSLAGGRALFDLGQSRKNPIPVFAEMGSVNPIFIFPSAINDENAKLASALASSMSMTAGQFCTNPGILFMVEHQDARQLINSIKIELQKIPSVALLNPGIARNFHKGIQEAGGVDGVEFLLSDQLNDHSAAPVLALVEETTFINNTHLHHEIFGPYSIIVMCKDVDSFYAIAENLEGQLTATMHADAVELKANKAFIQLLSERAGRIVFNGVPTGVEVCDAMTHGGPYPASTDSRFTAVGKFAWRRWLRPVTYQNFPLDWNQE
jgi:alpha-ketoglutaric semialdehyde dehydrogenase